jgi:RNA polymerase sigma-70 factor (sigma-E family)
MMMTGHTRPASETTVPTADETIDDLYRLHHVRLVRLAVLLTSDAGVAEEIVQEAFVALWRRWDKLRDVEAAAAYARTSVVNLSRSFLRRKLLEIRHRTRRGGDAVEIDPADRIDLLGAVRRLPGRQRECIALRFYADLSESETARTLGISVGTVKSQTHKALRRLEQMMGGDDGRS